MTRDEKAGHGDTKLHNRALILRTVFHHGPVSRAEVSRRTGLTRVTVSAQMADLIHDGYVRETGVRQAGRPGRPASLVTLEASGNHVVGIDVSDVETFRGVVYDLGGRIHSEVSLPTDRATGDPALAVLEQLSDRLVVGLPGRLLGIGVGSPGYAGPNGVVTNARNLDWQRIPLAARLSERHGRPVAVANDANLAAIAERNLTGSPNLMVVMLRSGLGAGLIVEGRPIVGASFAAGDIGHVETGVASTSTCRCGSRSCLEAWIGPAHMDERLSAGDRECIPTAIERLAQAIGPLVTGLDLEDVAILGPDWLRDTASLARLSDKLQKHRPPHWPTAVRVRASALGHDAVQRGAADLVLRRTLGIP